MKYFLRVLAHVDKEVTRGIISGALSCPGAVGKKVKKKNVRVHQCGKMNRKKYANRIAHKSQTQKVLKTKNKNNPT